MLYITSYQHYETSVVPLTTRLPDQRRRVGLTLTALAARIGISRQALTAIEAGRSTPSTAIALALARELGCQVEDLFALTPPALSVHLAPGLAGSRVVVGQVGERWVAHSLGPRSTAAADGVMDASGAVQPLGDRSALARNVLVAGCAPVLGALAGHIERTRDGRATWLPASSGTSLEWLASGLVHVAGLHLAERSRPGMHDALLRAALPGVPVEVVSLVGWRQGLVVAHGNPLGLKGPEDLARPELRIAQRQPGAGASKVLAKALASTGTTLSPESPRVFSHAEAAQAVRLGAVDVAVAIEPMAEAYQLPFIPLSEERFELAIRTEHLAHPGVTRLLDRLAAAGFAREVAGMGAYDLNTLGQIRHLVAA